MFLVNDKFVFIMAMLRFLSCLIELSAALLFIKFDSIEKALKINAGLALIGPLIMSAVMMTGLAGLSSKGFPISKFLIILAGVIIIFIGIGKGR